MRIAIVTPVFPPYRGGIGTVADHDARNLRALDNDVDVFTPNHKTITKKEVGTMRLQPFYAWGNAAVLTDLLTKLRGYDVVHLHYPFFGSDILAALAAKLWSIPLVVTYHMKPKAAGILGFTFRVYRMMIEPFVFRVAKTVLVSSLDYAKEHGVKHKNIVALPFGVDTDRFVQGSREEARRLFGLKIDVPTIVFVGGLDDAHYFKGVDVLLAACKAMKAEWQLLIVGDGNRRSFFEQIAKDLGIIGRVHFAKSVPFEDLPRAYQCADVHVLPSIDRSEAFGIVTLEAMASGVPSIVSDLPGVRSLVIPNETGSLVFPNDANSLTEALDLFCGNLDSTKEFGRHARVRACAVYDERVLIRRLVDEYKKCFL